VANDADAFPDDPAELKRIIAQRDAVIAERDRQIVQMQARHKAEMLAILRRCYGPRSETFDPTQLLLFGLAVAEEIPVDAKVIEAESGEKLTTRRINHHKHGRQKLPEHLPRIEITHDLTSEQKKCPCCDQMRTCIGSEVNEQLEFVPASFKVLRHVRLKYACNACSKSCNKCDCKAHVEIATKPAQPIEKGLPGPGLLAHVIVSKLGDHLPLYRLEGIFDRAGVSIARSTMCAWMLAASKLVEPLVRLMRDRVKQSKVIHTDDTTVKVQDANLKGRCRTGRVWCYLGDESNPYDVFDFTPDRKREHPQKFLDDFHGYLQADAYGGYDGIFVKGDVIEVACWAHARRKFFEAKETDGRRAHAMLRMIGRLYRIERAIKSRIEKRLKVTPDEAKAQPAWPRDQQHEFVRVIRQKRSAAMLMKIKTWLDAEKPIVLPRSPMGEAITYALNQWDALCRYTEQGYLNIDNNAAERALKRVAIGRKNWLFAGHDDAGRSHAKLYTLIASAQRHGLDPHAYLRSVLAKIGQTKGSELDQFLPEKWKAEATAETLPHVT
jgi:transposase